MCLFSIFQINVEACDTRKNPKCDQATVLVTIKKDSPPTFINLPYKITILKSSQKGDTILSTTARDLDNPVSSINSFISSIFASASHQTGLDTRSMTRRSIIMGIRGGEGGSRAGLEPYLSWLIIGSLSGPDETNMVQARIPIYSLNWTARSRAITKVTTVSMLQIATRRWSSRSQGPFGFKSAGHRPLVNVAARPTDGGPAGGVMVSKLD